MSNQEKELAVQTYERKVLVTLREEKYELDILKKNKEFLDGLPNMGTELSLSYKFYKDAIKKVHDDYVKAFEELILPLIIEHGITFDPPEEALGNIISSAEQKITKFIELIQIVSRITTESFYNLETIKTTWSLCLNGVSHIPFMISLGATRMIVLDENFKMDLHFFASLGAMPDIKPLTKAGNIDMPPGTFSITLQLMVGTSFKQISIILLSQKLQDLKNFLAIMTNIGLIVDTKIDVYDDFAGLRWVKNSFQYSLFKKKEFMDLVKSLKIGGIVIDKSVSPMQVQKIQTLVKTNVNLSIGFEIFKLGTIQYSFLQKKEEVHLIYDSFENVICKLPDFLPKTGSSNKFSTY